MKAVMTIMVAALLVAPVMARGFDTSTAAFTQPGSRALINLPYSTGFEAPEFALGAIEPQNGWGASGTNDVWSSVSNLGPKTGTQHNRQVFRPAAAQGATQVTLGPQAWTMGYIASTMEVDVRISNTLGADYDFGVQAPSDGFIVSRVKNNYYYGGVYVLDIDPNGALAYAYTGFDYTPNVYYHFKQTVDPVAGTITYDFNNGAVVYVGATPTATTRAEMFYTVHDNYQLTGEYGDYDNLVMTPEPAALAVLALGAIFIRRR